VTSSERSTVDECLSRLGVGGQVGAYESIGLQISGSRVYRFEIDDQTVVLKVTLKDSPPYVRERADREYWFYRTMAARLSLAVPRLLASHRDESFGVCLLFAHCQAAGPAATWREGDYIEMARQLAAFHALHWGQTEALDGLPWLRTPPSSADEVGIEEGRSLWRSVHSQPRLRGLLPAEMQRVLGEAFARLPAIEATRRSLPLTLVHGDCHIGNLLRGADGGLIWADWQEVGLGRGPEDLCFLFQRACAEGGDVPEGSVIDAYARILSLQTSAEVPVADVRRTMDAYELVTLLLEWPTYIQEAPAGMIRGLLERVARLAARP